MARLFRLCVPAAQVVTVPGSWRATAYRYCKRIRRRLTAAHQTALDSIVYSDGWKASNKLSLNGFHHKRINHQEEFANGKNNINGIENFWGYAKRRLKAYHGGFKRNFSLCIREMEFRFNHRDADNTQDILRSILRACS
ncbi:MAG: hypothetical protein GF399_04775 [Candidatus Coatesbacteria bacterium]|nr:hypothetical protein [Candidatus Coatesbacteria bacterium]